MIQLTDPTVLVNNEPVAVVPNSVAYTEGLGEQEQRAASVGEGRVEAVYSRNLETSIAMVKFSLFVTPESIELARQWKAGQNGNVVQIAGSTLEGSVERTFSQAALVNDYEVNIGADGEIELEFKGAVSV